MAGKQASYQEVQEQAQRGFAKAQLADPESHFPYKGAQALQALNTPPDPGTNNHPEHWYTSEPIIDASQAMVEAQEAYLKNPGDGTREAYEQAKRDLVAARQQHRQGRSIAPVAVAGNPADIEQRRSAIRALGAQGYDAATIANLLQRPLAEVEGALAGRED